MYLIKEAAHLQNKVTLVNNVDITGHWNIIYYTVVNAASMGATIKSNITFETCWKWYTHWDDQQRGWTWQQGGK